MSKLRATTLPGQLSPIRWRWLASFLFCFAIGFGFAVFVAWLLGQGQVPESSPVRFVLFGGNWWTLGSPYSILVVSGTMGGLLCSFLLEDDKTLEYPAWTKDGKGLSLGFLGDALVGIGGALIAYIVLPRQLLLGSGPGNIDYNVSILVAGLVGGYGGKSVLTTALQRLVKRVNEANLADEQLAITDRIANLRALAIRQIEEGLPPAELQSLQEQLATVANNPNQLEQDIASEIFRATIDTRRLGSRVKIYSEYVNRSIPILLSLSEARPDNHDYKFQLGLSFRDALPPRLKEAIQCINEAILLRDSNPQNENGWRYELERAVALILQSKSLSQKPGKDDEYEKLIMADLAKVQKMFGLARAFSEFESVQLAAIQDWLQLRPAQARELLPQLRSVTESVSASRLNEPLISTPPDLPMLGRPLGAVTINERLAQVPLEVPQVPAQRLPLPDRWDRALEKARLITTGASSATARQDSLPVGGVRSSEKMAETDWRVIQKYVDRLYIAAAKYDVPPAIIAAIASRESRGGSLLAPDGTGDHGAAFGIMQVDRRYWAQVGAGRDPASQMHINQGTEIYADYRKQIAISHPNWSDEYLLKGAAAAYNSGPKNIQTLARMDQGTTGEDYGSDVIARACLYAGRLKSLAICKAELSLTIPSLLAEQSDANFPITTAAQGTNGSRKKPSSMPQRITALRDTFLKQRPVQAALLSDQEKRQVAAGQSFSVSAHKDVGSGHFQVTLEEDGRDWFIYDGDADGHWNTSWEGSEIDPPGTNSPISALGEIIQTPGKIDWGKDDLRISKYFCVGEVTKGDHRRRPKPNSDEERSILAIALELDKIRVDWGSAIIVTSWFRPSPKSGYLYDVNKECRGVSNSQHIYGRAVDVRTQNPADIRNFQAWLEKNWYGHLGLGAQRGFVHLDMRNGKGWKATGPKGDRFPY